MVYNNPGRTGINLTTEDYAALAGAGRLFGVKECSRDLADFSRTVAEMGDKWAILSGEDDLLYPSLELGAAGGIITTGNVVPALWVDMYAAITAGDHARARAVHYAVLPLIEVVYTLNHPALVKGALRTLGLAGGSTRAPLRRSDPRTGGADQGRPRGPEVDRVRAVAPLYISPQDVDSYIRICIQGQ